jgi:hypothetical protein
MPPTAVLANHMFSPDEVQILVSAFDDAWATTKRSASLFASARYEHGTREIIAKHIAELAKQGIMDRHPLCAAAITAVAGAYRWYPT